MPPWDHEQENFCSTKHLRCRARRKGHRQIFCAGINHPRLHTHRISLLGEMVAPFRYQIAIGASVAFLGASMMMLVMPSGAEEKPGRLSQPSLIVTPAGNVAFSGPRGGPFSPARFAFQVSSRRAQLVTRLGAPSWLTASSKFCTTEIRGVTITLTVNAHASHLSPAAYRPACTI